MESRANERDNASGHYRVITKLKFHVKSSLINVNDVRSSLPVCGRDMYLYTHACMNIPVESVLHIAEWGVSATVQAHLSKSRKRASPKLAPLALPAVRIVVGTTNLQPARLSTGSITPFGAAAGVFLLHPARTQPRALATSSTRRLAPSLRQAYYLLFDQSAHPSFLACA